MGRAGLGRHGVPSPSGHKFWIQIACDADALEAYAAGR
jgi:hypothetical protein|eukprot:SAG25_NODE_373_length_8948_cov_6.275059_12_plen_38_part_00